MIEKIITFYSDSEYDNYKGNIITNNCGKINTYLEKDYFDNFTKLYPRTIYIQEDMKKIDFNDMLFCRLGIPTEDVKSTDHVNFTIFDKNKNEVYIYEPNGKGMFFLYHEDSIDQYKKFMAKMLDCNHLDDIKMEKEEFEVMHTFNRQHRGIQYLSQIPLCSFFSMYINILVFAMYQICDENEKTNIGELTKCVEQMVIASFKGKKLDMQSFMYRAAFRMAEEYIYKIISEENLSE